MVKLKAIARGDVPETHVEVKGGAAIPASS